MANDRSAVQQLIYSCQGLVRSIAWTFHQKLPSSVELDDLIGYGQVGLAEAARDYDETRGVQFTTYAYYRVRGAILDGLSRMSWFNQADFNRGRYERAANEVLKDIDTETDSTTAENAVWMSRATRSLGAAFMLTQLSSSEIDIADSSQEQVSSEAEHLELRRQIELALDELPDAEREMIVGVYFDGLSIKDAGERLNVGKAWASRLHSRALELLSFKLSGEAAEKA